MKDHMFPTSKKPMPKDPVKFLSGPPEESDDGQSCYDEVHGLVQKYGQSEVQQALDECSANENAETSGEAPPDNATSY